MPSLLLLSALSLVLGPYPQEARPFCEVEILHTGSDALLVALAASGNSRLIVAGGDEESGLLLRSDDAGATWERTSAASRLYALEIRADGAGLACGLHGVLLATADGGATWERRTLPFAADQWLAGLAHVDARRAVVVGGGADTVLARTFDGGVTWTDGAAVLPQTARRGGLRAVVFVDESTGFASGNDGLLVRTRDGGESWTLLASGSTAWLKSLSFLDARRGFVGGSGGAVLATEDGGEIWRALPFPSTEKINALLFLDAERGFAGTMEGTLWGTLDGGATWAALHRGGEHVTSLRIHGDSLLAACDRGQILRAVVR